MNFIGDTCGLFFRAIKLNINLKAEIMNRKKIALTESQFGDTGNVKMTMLRN